MTTLFDLETLEVPRAAQIEACNAAAERRGFDNESAAAFILEYLAAGPAHAEPILAAAKASGLKADDGRAWGYVFQSLARRGLIVKAGSAPRYTGNPCWIWRRAR